MFLVTVDTLRADRLGAYGGPAGLTPSLDRFAREAARFDPALSPRGLTGPALTTLVTARYPIRHGARENGVREGFDGATLAAALAEAGYRVALESANLAATPTAGFPPGSVGTVDKSLFKGPGADLDAHYLARALKWTRENKGKGPLFLWLHLFAPHAPYDPPARTLGRGVKAPAGVSGTRDFLDGVALGRRTLSSAEVDYVVSLYDAEVRAADEAFGRFVEALKAEGLWENAIVVFSADHGEELHRRDGYFYHTASIYDAVLRVPLLIRLPGGEGAGKLVGGLTETIDAAPTVLDAAGVPAPPSFEGVSLLPRLRGAAGGRKYAFGELFVYDGRKGYTVRSERFRYVRSLAGPRAGVKPSPHLAMRLRPEEFYDLKSDPNELVEAGERFPEELAEHRAALDEWLARFGPTEKIVPRPADADLKRLLELGYMR